MKIPPRSFPSLQFVSHIPCEIHPEFDISVVKLNDIKRKITFENENCDKYLVIDLHIEQIANENVIKGLGYTTKYLLNELPDISEFTAAINECKLFLNQFPDGEFVKPVLVLQGIDEENEETLKSEYSHFNWQYSTAQSSY